MAVSSKMLKLLLASIFSLLLMSLLAIAEEDIKKSLSDLNQIISPTRPLKLPWGRDPFIPPSVEKIRIGAQDTGLKDLRLSVIIFNGKDPTALINKNIVKIGDTINGQKIVDIRKDYVILQSNGRSYRLGLTGLIKNPEDIKGLP